MIVSALSKSPLIGYVLQGLYYLLFVLFIKLNVISFPVSDLVLIIFYSSIISQVVNLGNNLSINYFLPKDIDKNFAPFFLYSAIIVISLFAFSFAVKYVFNIDFLLSINFSYLIVLSLFISLNKVVLSILLSIKDYKIYSLINFFRLILFLIIIKNFDVYYTLLLVEVLLFFVSIFCIHVFLSYKYFFVYSDFINYFQHGFRVFWGNFLYDFLFKIDLFLFSLKIPKIQLEELTFSVLLFEYFYQFVFVIRLKLFTVITRLYSIHKSKSSSSSLKEFKFILYRISKKYKLYLNYFSLCTIFILITAYKVKFISELCLLNTILLIVGVLFSSSGHILQLIFNQIGYPFIQSVYFLITTIFVLIIYYIHLTVFSYNYIYVTSFLSTFIIGLNVLLFIKFISYYEQYRIAAKRLL